MRTLIVGGAGMIGGRAALDLRTGGHDVVLAGRTPPGGETPFGDFPFLSLDFLDDDVPLSIFEGFEAVVFAAGQDPRHVAGGLDMFAYKDPESSEARRLMEANGVKTPRFFAKLRNAGVEVAINIGTLYPQAAPHMLADDPYMRSRKAADEAVCALARPGFRAMSLNPAWVMGAIPGQTLPVSLWDEHMAYAAGLVPDLSVFAPPGGTNIMSSASVSDAIHGALWRGEGGRSYLLGDQNVTFQQFLGAFFEAFGREPPPVRDEAHPTLTDMAIRRGETIWYEPAAADLERLAWRRNDALRAICEEMVPDFKARRGLEGSRA